MASVDDLGRALQAAHAAGDEDHARTLAKAYSDAKAATVATPDAQSAAPVAQPSIIDRLQTNPVIGAPLQTVMRAGQGTEQLLAHSAADLADLGGHAPNSFADVMRAIANHMDTTNAGQNQRYEGAKQRVIAASPNPRFENAAINTGETMGNMLNPAGMTGNLVKTAPGIIGAGERGLVSGAAFGATQPVTGDDPDYWTGKAKQVAIGAVTGTATGATAEALGPKTTTPPGSVQFKAKASDAYKQAEDQGIVVKSASFQDAIKTIADKAERAGADTALTPKSTAVLARLAKEVDAANAPPADETGKFQPTPGVTFERLDTIRKVANSALDSPEKNDRRIAHIIIDGLDDYVSALKPGDIKSATGDVNVATAALNDARDQFTRGSKLETIERLQDKARDTVGANYTQAGYDTALRQQFKQLKRNPAAFRRWSPDEQAQITSIIRGVGPQNFLRQFGKIAPAGTLPILSELGAASGAVMADRPAVAAGVAGAAGLGLLSRNVANVMGTRNVSRLSDLVRGTSPAPRPTPNALIWNPLPGLTVQAFGKPGGQ